MAHKAILNESRVFRCRQTGEQRMRRSLKNLRTFLSAHLTPCLILWGLLVVVGHAQQPSNTSSSGTSISAQAKNVPAASDRVVLRVGNVKVTKEEFESGIEGIEPHGGDSDK